MNSVALNEKSGMPHLEIISLKNKNENKAWEIQFQKLNSEAIQTTTNKQRYNLKIQKIKRFNLCIATVIVIAVVIVMVIVIELL